LNILTQPVAKLANILISNQRTVFSLILIKKCSQIQVLKMPLPQLLKEIQVLNVPDQDLQESEGNLLQSIIADYSRTMATVLKRESGKADKMNSSSTINENVINNLFSRTNPPTRDLDQAQSPLERSRSIRSTLDCSFLDCLSRGL
jgi:hypothetical protein